jgi:hypothetical protein
LVRRSWNVLDIVAIDDETFKAFECPLPEHLVMFDPVLGFIERLSDKAEPMNASDDLTLNEPSLFKDLGRASSVALQAPSAASMASILRRDSSPNA